MYRFIAMHCGYIESFRTSLLIYQCQYHGIPGYTSMKQAITDLALDLYRKFYDDHLSIYKNRREVGPNGFLINECCRNSLFANPAGKACITCGGKLEDKDFDAEKFMYYVSDLHETTCDSYGDADGIGLHWYPFWNEGFIGAPKEDIIYICESAEVTLLCALIEAKPELKVNKKYSSHDWDTFKEEKRPSYY